MFRTTTYFVLTLLAVVAFSTSFAQAQPRDGRGNADRGGPQATDQTDQDKPNRGRRHHGDSDKRGDFRKRIHDALFKGIELTEQQKQQVKEVFDQTRAQHRNWREQNKEQLQELRQQMREAHQDDDGERIKELRDQLRKLFEAAPKPADALEQIEGILTADQREQFAQNSEAVKQKFADHQGQRGPGGPGQHMRNRILHMLFKDIDLTEEQKEQVHQIMEPFKDKRKAWHEENQEKMKDLRQQIRQAHKDHDKEKVKELGAQMKQLHESAPKPDKELDQVASEVLDADQREQFAQNREKIKQWFENHRPGKGNHDRRRLNDDDGDDADSQDQRPRRRPRRSGRGGGDQLDL